MEKHRPTYGTIVIEVLEGRKSTKGGILLPPTANENKTCRRGRVVAAGDGRVLDNGTKLPMLYKKGDVVVFPTFEGADFRLNGTDFVLLQMEQVLEIIDDPYIEDVVDPPKAQEK